MKKLIIAILLICAVTGVANAQTRKKMLEMTIPRTVTITTDTNEATVLVTSDTLYSNAVNVDGFKRLLFTIHYTSDGSAADTAVHIATHKVALQTSWNGLDWQNLMITGAGIDTTVTSISTGDTIKVRTRTQTNLLADSNLTSSSGWVTATNIQRIGPYLRASLFTYDSLQANHTALVGKKYKRRVTIYIQDGL